MKLNLVMTCKATGIKYVVPLPTRAKDIAQTNFGYWTPSGERQCPIIKNELNTKDYTFEFAQVPDANEVYCSGYANTAQKYLIDCLNSEFSSVFDTLDVVDEVAGTLSLITDAGISAIAIMVSNDLGIKTCTDFIMSGQWLDYEYYPYGITSFLMQTLKTIAPWLVEVINMDHNYLELNDCLNPMLKGVSNVYTSSYVPGIVVPKIVH